jgi:hypothetical protein
MILKQITKPQLLLPSKASEPKHAKKLSSHSDPAAPGEFPIVTQFQKPNHKKNKSEIPPINFPAHIFYKQQ